MARERREIKRLKHVRLRLKAGKPLRACFGSRRAASVTTGDISRYVTDQKLNERKAKGRKGQGRGHATVNREVELFLAAFRLGVASKRIVRMPVFLKKLRGKNVARDPSKRGIS